MCIHPKVWSISLTLCDTWEEGGEGIRGENIMLQNQRIMLCSDAHNLCQLCSTNKLLCSRICHYASKQNNFLGHKNTFSHRTVTKHIYRKVTKLKNRSKVSLISHACCTVSKMPQCNLGVHHPGATTELVVFGHFFPSKSRETAHVQYVWG